MRTSPLISVLVPVHNAGPFLVHTVNSVLAQTFRDFELILIDDGSTDDCMASITFIGDPRLRVVTQDQQGAVMALNTGVGHARGEFIALLDHDDLWLPRKLEYHLACFAAHPEAELTFDWSRMIDEGGRDLGLPSRAWRGTVTFEQLLEDFVIGNSSAIVVSRAAIERGGSLNPFFTHMYDVDLCLRVASYRPDNCRSVPQYLTLYRRHAGQMSGDWRKLQEQWRSLIDAVPDYAPGPVAHLLPAADSNMHRYFAWIACEEGDFSSALRLGMSAVRCAPTRALTDVRNWLVLGNTLSSLFLPRRAHATAAEFGKRLFRFTRR